MCEGHLETCERADNFALKMSVKHQKIGFALGFVNLNLDKPKQPSAS